MSRTNKEAEIVFAIRELRIWRIILISTLIIFTQLENADSLFDFTNEVCACKAQLSPDEILEILNRSENSRYFENGGVVLMMGETTNSHKMMRIEQVVRIGKEGEKIGLPDELYQDIHDRIDEYASLSGTTAKDLVDFPGKYDNAGDFVCGVTFNSLLEYSLAHPEAKILPIFIHVQRVKPDKTIDPKVFDILGIVEDAMKDYFVQQVALEENPLFVVVYED